jgi:hypothetical protein
MEISQIVGRKNIGMDLPIITEEHGSTVGKLY